MPVFAGIKRIEVTVDNNDANEFIKPFLLHKADTVYKF